MAWDDDLAGPARQIATVNASPLRVVAGPGTGKTFALIKRTARLLSEGADPQRILVCTFTRAAATDLKRELTRQRIPGAENVWAGTLHSFCFGLLNRAEVLERTSRHPRPLMDFETKFLIQDLNDELFGGIDDRKELLHAFNGAWARLQHEAPGWPTNQRDRAFQNALQTWLIFHQAMLIGEIVPVTLEYLRNNPASPFVSAFDHVLVDEYQDLNKAEQVLSDFLAQRGNLAVVGDEDQSIYSFKNAHPEGIANFGDTHAGTHDEALVDCRRCPTRIVEMANHLIQRNASRASRVLQPVPDNPLGEVRIVQWANAGAEAQGIAQFIQERMARDNISPGQVLVLSPRRQFGYAVRDALNERAVLAQSFFLEEALDGNPKHLEQSRAQQVFTLLTLLARPDDRVALRCWCGFGSPSLRTGAWARLRAYSEAHGVTPRELLAQLEAGTVNLSNIGDLVARYRQLRDELNRLAEFSGPELVDELFPEGQPWASPFRTYAATIAGTEFTAPDLLDVLRIAITQPELPTEVDYVRVMSLHKSKGLTADLVVVVGCLQGLIPFVDNRKPAAEQAKLLEEQRRLFYVAITRTRNALVILSAVRVPLAAAHAMGLLVGRKDAVWVHAIPSTFLNELGPARPDSERGESLLEE